MATHFQYSCLGNPMDREACQGSQKELDLTNQLDNK